MRYVLFLKWDWRTVYIHTVLHSQRQNNQIYNRFSQFQRNWWYLPSHNNPLSLAVTSRTAPTDPPHSNRHPAAKTSQPFPYYGLAHKEMRLVVPNPSPPPPSKSLGRSCNNNSSLEQSCLQPAGSKPESVFLFINRDPTWVGISCSEPAVIIFLFPPRQT